MDLQHHAALTIELEHTDALQGTVGAHGTDIDGQRVAIVFFLEPGAGGAGGRGLAQVLGLGHQGHALGGGRNVVADRHCQYHKADAQQQHGAQRQPGPQAAGAHDGELRALRKSGHHKDAADQHGNRQQFVQMVRDAQGHGQQGMPDGVGGIAHGAAHIAHLVEQVKEKEQRQKRQGHKADGTDGVAVDQSAQCLHAVAPRRCHRSLRCQRWWRMASPNAASTKTLPCTPST